MTDDKPISDELASELWLAGPYAIRHDYDFRRLLAFVLERVGPALAIDAKTDLLRHSSIELVGLAVRAHRAGLGDDVVGSILIFASGRGSSVAKWVLAQLLARRLQAATEAGASIRKRIELQKVLRSLAHRSQIGTMVDEFDVISKELAGASEAIAKAELWSEYRRSRTGEATHKIVAPKLRTLKNFESGAEEFRILADPLPLWRSPVPPAVLAGVLEAEFPHLSGVVDEVARFIAGGAAASMRPILLIGLPGIGKDSLLRRAAELVKRPLGELDLAGTSDNRILRGTAKGWSSAHPSFPTTLCAQHQCPNPIVQLSELDRAGGNRRHGQVHEALLSLCEPTTRRRWFDEGLGTEVDLSDVAFAFTSNSTDDTPRPLLSRLRVFHLEPPGPEHVAAILQQAQRRFAAESNLPIESLPEFAPEVIDRLKVLARQKQFNLRLADRIARAIGGGGRDVPRH
ncbi:MAG: AAA family ATPase [Rhodospirillales bacterium]|nr:AAA family ATPase [Rhodospirillales bacterium]